MSKNLIQPSAYEDEIDLQEIFKILIESKKIIIVTILIFTITSIIYSLSLKPEFKSSIIFEIGYSEMPDGTQKSIEKPSDLISNLNLYQYLNSQENNQVASFKAIENKLILIETTSKSGEQNENLLVEIFRNIDERHSNLTFLSKNQKKDEISLQIEMIEAEISFIRAKQLSKAQMIESELSFTKAKELSKVEDRLAKLTNVLPFIDQEISQLEKIILDDNNNLSLLKENENMLKERAANSPTLEQIIYTYNKEISALNRLKSSYILEIKSLNNQLKTFENDTFRSELFSLEQEETSLEIDSLLFSLEQEKAILENELQMLMNQTQVNTRLIGNIETDTLKPKTLIIISLGIIFGFFTSIFLVFISNFLKSFRKVKA